MFTKRLCLLTFLIVSSLVATALAKRIKENSPERHFNADFPGLQQRVYITEVCVVPPSGSDWPAWVEIWNNTGRKIDLGGYTLETLQNTLEPFGEEFVLEPDERCVVMAYAGSKPSKEFESMLPAGTKTARIMNLELFPSYFTKEEWSSKLKVLSDALRAMEMTNGQLAHYVAMFFGTTRYINEIAIRTPTGELVAFVNWGRYIRDSETSEALQEAYDKDIRAKWNYNPVFHKSDTECAVLQMSQHGIYVPLWGAEDTCTPGAPLLRIPSVPILSMPVEIRFSSEEMYGSFFRLVLKIERRYVSRDLERMWGWAQDGIIAEFYYDREMTKPVFDSPVVLSDDRSFNIKPVDFFCLAGVPLYCRVVKTHPTDPPVCSELHKMRLVEKRTTSAEMLPLKPNVKIAEVNHKYGVADVEKVAQYLEQCNAACVKYKQHVLERKGKLSYNIVDAGREVKVRFSYKDNMEDLFPLAGLPMRKIDVSNSKVKDLTPLKGMPLQELDLQDTPVSDLSPLKGMRLKKLNLRNTRVSDISELRGMPLEELDISRTSISNLTPLIDAPLQRLKVDSSKVKDIDAVLKKDVEKTIKKKGGLTTINFIRKHSGHE